MKRIFVILLMFLLASCTSHFISDSSQRAEVHKDFEAKKAAMPYGDLFSVFNENLTVKQREALEFLYAYMPSCDVADYSGDYFLRNVDASFLAKDELSWGRRVPEREFNHFVMPVRVNNENLDDFRFVYYDELRDRVKDLSMYDAVLEVNHWCHEKVNYKGSDSRTSAPMATIKTSWGRCGEESTLLVAALRTVCIPARQVYTPRWAHCDDNHAWVEAWVDGKWHFLGACEPEPVLDLGWFNAPASRALLLHTRVFGKYFGPEEVIDRNANYTEINVIDNYAKTAKLNVKVVDNEGNAVPDARVDFKIYNYSEYCTVATKHADNEGNTWLTAGLGTMMVYASKDGKFGYEVVKIGDVDNIMIELCRDGRKSVSSSEQIEEDYDIIPPAENAYIPDVSAEMRAENNRRLSVEDSIRNAYVAGCIAAQNEGDYDREIMAKTWGNYQTIKDFVDYARTLDREEDAYKILHNLTDKDLRDVTLDVLVDCIDNNVFNPRVSNEMLRPFSTAGCDVDTIIVNDDLNVRHIPMSPSGVARARVTDSHSYEIFNVACSRRNGDDVPATTKTGILKINFNADADPRYYTHFSIKKFNGNTFDLLAYDAMDPGMDVGLLYSQLMEDDGLRLEPGYYVMSSGPRRSDGSVLNHIVFFTIEEGKTTEIELVMRSDVSSLIGERIVAYLDGGSEPTTHAMQDISILKDRFNNLGGNMTFFFQNEDDFKNFKLKNFNDLPQNIVFEINQDIPTTNLPIFLIFNEKNEVIFESKGYTIGLGEQLLRHFSE
ncbi:MAG: transglutaminase domain-containing protein [Bacteroidales bacterium]|nr:transglutaminase domain-containing protein [Bacteroidales bacterium]